MTSGRLALSILALGAGAMMVAGTARARQVRAEAAHPPVGQFVTVDGLRVHHVEAGSGPDLILLHGAYGNLRDFTFGLFDRLTPHFRVIAFDRPGLGYSDPLPRGGFSLADQVAVLRGAADQLGVTRPVLLGHSFGGSVALEWGLQGGPAALALLSAPSLPWPDELDLSYRVLSNPVSAAVMVPLVSVLVGDRGVAAKTEAIFAPEAVPVGYSAHIGANLALRPATLGANARQVNGLRPQVVAMEPRYAGLRLPVELIHGDADTVVPLAIHSARLVDLAPDARLTVIPGGGHMPQHLHPGLVVETALSVARRAGLR